MEKKQDYKIAYSKLLQEQEALHQKNVKRIRWGIRSAIVIPLVFMILMFVMGSSKTTYLVLWIASLFLICGYIIYVEYYDYTLQKMLQDAGIKTDDIEKLLPENTIETRIQEIEKYIGEDVVEDEKNT